MIKRNIILVLIFISQKLFCQINKADLAGTWELVGISETADTNLVYLLQSKSEFVRLFKGKTILYPWNALLTAKTFMDTQSVLFVQSQQNHYIHFTKDSIYDEGRAGDSTFQQKYSEFDSSYLHAFPLMNLLYVCNNSDSLVINRRFPGGGYMEALWYYNIKFCGPYLRLEELNYSGMIRYFRRRTDAGF